MIICPNPPCSEAEPFRYCPVKDCGWMEGQEPWSADVQVRNALLHAIEIVKGGKADTYDIDAVVGSLMGDGMKVVSTRG